MTYADQWDWFNLLFNRLIDNKRVSIGCALCVFIYVLLYFFIEKSETYKHSQLQTSIEFEHKKHHILRVLVKLIFFCSIYDSKYNNTDMVVFQLCHKRIQIS